MSIVRKLSAAIALCLLGASVSARAADCDANFSSSGNFLSGQQFKTFALLPNVSADEAFVTVQRHLATQGWAIQHADRTSGVLTAWYAGSRPERPVPLNAAFERAQGGTKLTLAFSTPGGAFSTSASVREEFCKITAVALAAPVASTAAVAVPSTQGGRASGGAGSEQNLPAASAPSGQICLGKACLGMTLEEAAALPLVEAAFSSFKTHDNGDCLVCGSTYGMNSKGQRIWYPIPPLVDQKWIRQYSQTVKVACMVGAPSAHMKASDGELIILHFAPAIHGSKGVMELVHITRFLPKTMSESQWKAFEQQAKERYGSAFYSDRALSASFEPPRGPYVTVRTGELSINGVRSEVEVNQKLKEQPGCSERTSLE
jgi:hypothetical protein